MGVRGVKLHKCRKLHTLTCPVQPLTERVLITTVNRATFTETKSKTMSNLKNIKAMNQVKEAALWTIYIIVMAAAIAGAMLVG